MTVSATSPQVCSGGEIVCTCSTDPMTVYAFDISLYLARRHGLRAIASISTANFACSVHLPFGDFPTSRHVIRSHSRMNARRGLGPCILGRRSGSNRRHPLLTFRPLAIGSIVHKAAQDHPSLFLFRLARKISIWIKGWAGPTVHDDKLQGVSPRRIV